MTSAIMPANLFFEIWAVTKYVKKRQNNPSKEKKIIFIFINKSGLIDLNFCL